MGMWWTDKADVALVVFAAILAGLSVRLLWRVLREQLRFLRELLAFAWEVVTVVPPVLLHESRKLCAEVRELYNEWQRRRRR